MNRSLITGLLVLLGSTPLLAQGTTFGQGANTPGQMSTTGGIGTSPSFGGNTSTTGGQTAAGSFDISAVPQTSNRAGQFIGSNANAQQGAFVGGGLQQGFTGAQTGGAQNLGAFGNAGGFGAQGRGLQGRGLQGRGQQQGGGQQGRGASTRVVRTKVSVGFIYQGIAAPAVKSHLDAQFARLAASGRLSGSDISATPQETTVVLRGHVSSARDRDLAERVARFEPGVSVVINELVVMDATP